MNRRPWLNLEHRKKIEKMYSDGCPVVEIARALDADRSVIYRELQRGRTGGVDKNGKPEYSAEVAQEKSYWNKKRIQQQEV